MTKDVDNLKILVGERLKEAIKQLGTTQKLFAKAAQIPLPSLSDYIRGKSMPGGEAMHGISSIGINTNWLLTGEAPMLLADLVAPAPAGVNVDAMVQAIVAIFTVSPKGESVERLARKAVAFYEYCESQGLITPEGEGTGVLKNTA